MHNNGIHVRLSKQRIALLGAAILVLAFFTLLFFAFRPMFPNGENDLRSRHKTAIDSAKSLPDAGDERDVAIKKITGEFLDIALHSKNSITKSTAYASAGSLMLREYVLALKRLELESDKLSKPSPRALTSAIEYFSEAASICADAKDRKPCFFGEQAQRELDYALLLEQDIRAKRSGGNQESGKTKTKDSGSVPLGPSTQKEKDNPGGTPQSAPTGSIRGALSEEPKENGRHEENGSPAGGGGFELSTNQP